MDRTTQDAGVETVAESTAESTAVARTRWGPVIAIGIAMLAMSIDTTIVAVVLPAIGSELGVGPAATKWVILGTALPLAALTIPAGRWADRANARSVLLFSVTGVALASVAGALAPTFWLLVVARVVIGMLGGLLISVYLPTVSANVRKEEHGRAMGYTSTIMPIGTMAGSSLGGLLADAYGWRPVLLIPIPLLLLALWLAYRTLPGSTGRGLPVPDRSLLLQTLVLGGAITTLLLASDQIKGAPVVAGVLAAVALVPAVWWTRLRSSRPVIVLIRRRAFGLPLLAILLVGSTIALTNFLLPYFVVDVLRRTPATMGIALLFSVGATAVSSPVGGTLADRHGPKRTALVGSFVALAGMVSMLTLQPDDGIVDLAWRLAVFGVGGGLFGVA
ncbi:MAG: MFS transporter, partial [Sciscionella sp.]